MLFKAIYCAPAPSSISLFLLLLLLFPDRHEWSSLLHYMSLSMMFCFTTTNTGMWSCTKISETRSQDKLCSLCCFSRIFGTITGNKQDSPERDNIGWKYLENCQEMLPKTVSIKATSHHCHLIGELVSTLMTTNLENWVKGDSAGKQNFWVSNMRNIYQ